MKALKTLAIVTAMFASQSVFAATYDLGDMGPPDSKSQNATISTRSFTDYFTFSLDSTAATTFGNAPDIYANIWSDDDPTLDITDIKLYRGNMGSGTLVNTDKDANAESFLFRNLNAGSYYFVVTGNKSSNSNITYTFSLATTAPATAVPEPEQYAMMLAGLGLIGFAARRRQA